LVVQPKESPSIISMGFFMPFSKVDTNKGIPEFGIILE